MFESLKPYTKFVRFFGFLLTLICISFLFSELVSEINTSNILNLSLVASVTILSITYCMISFFLCAGWHSLCKVYMHRPSLYANYIFYSKTQIYKYLPGNVFHYASRQIEAKGIGFPQSRVAVLSTYELFLLVILSIIICDLVLFKSNVFWITSIFLTLCAIKLLYDKKLNIERLKYGIISMTCYSVYLVLSGLIFSLVVFYIEPSIAGFGNLATFVGIYAYAWVIGVLTPGSPSGVGVREALMLISFEHYFEFDVPVSALVSSRIITISGDLLFFLSGHIVSKLGQGGKK